MTLTHADFREMARRAALRNGLEGFPRPLRGTTQEPAGDPQKENHHISHTIAGRLYFYDDFDTLAILADYDI